LTVIEPPKPALIAYADAFFASTVIEAVSFTVIEPEEPSIAYDP
jgi:hypothetical protein